MLPRPISRLARPLLFLASICLVGLPCAGCGQNGVTIAGSSSTTSDASGGTGAGGSAGVGGAGGVPVETGGSGGSIGTGGAAAGLSLLAWNLEQFPLTVDTPGMAHDILSNLHPDLVGVEEIEDDAAFYALVDTLPGYEALIADDPFGFTRVGLLYRTDRLGVSEVETLFKGDTYAFPRPPLKAHVTMLDGGFDFDFLVIHLKAQLDAESEARRLAACKALDAWVTMRISSGADPDIVLSGDWNDKITDDPAYNVFQVFLDAPDAYRFLTQPVADAGDYSYIPFQSLIDHVLVTSSALGAYGDGTTQALHLEETVPGYQDKLTDHRPILSEFAPAP